MKVMYSNRIGLFISVLILAGMVACSGSKAENEKSQEASPQQTASAPKPNPASDGPIQWLSIEEALAAQKQDPKPIFIDVYTDWCGWCKVMDKKTFSQPEVASYMNEHFHPVKFNAEKEKPLTVNGQEFKVVNAGRRGIHTFAYAILDGQMSYPSYVVLNENLQRMGMMKGFKEAGPFLDELKQVQ